MESPRWRGLARFSRQVHALFLKNLSFQVTKSLKLPLADALFTMHKCHFKKRKQPNPPSYSCLLECMVAFMPTHRDDAQRRNARTNAAIAAFPVLLCVLLVTIQHVVDSELERPPFRCGCVGTECGIQYSTPIQALACAVPVPPRWPPLVQVPPAEARALTRLRPRPCKASEKNCPATVLLTGQNRQLAQGTVQARDDLLRAHLCMEILCKFGWVLIALCFLRSGKILIALCSC
jgi:hypothetical protein